MRSKADETLVIVENASCLAKHSELESKNLNTVCLKVIQKGPK